MPPPAIGIAAASDQREMNRAVVAAFGSDFRARRAQHREKNIIRAANAIPLANATPALSISVISLSKHYPDYVEFEFNLTKRILRNTHNTVLFICTHA